MQDTRGIRDRKGSQSAHYVRGRFATVPVMLMRLMVGVQLGRNGCMVLLSLCRFVKPNGVFGKMPSKKIVEDTGMTSAQVARGMKELRDKLIIEPLPRTTYDGSIKPDRSNFGHVATYRFTCEAWSRIRDDLIL